MDTSSSSRKRKGLGGKGKLVVMSFYRATASANHNTTNTTTIRSVRSTTSGSGHNNNTGSATTPTFSAKPRAAAASKGPVEFIMKQEQVSPQAKQSVSILLQDSSRGYAASHVLDYGGLPVDESIDAKAATYISTVRERIRLQVQTINT